MWMSKTMNSVLQTNLTLELLSLTKSMFNAAELFANINWEIQTNAVYLLFQLNRQREMWIIANNPAA